MVLALIFALIAILLVITIVVISLRWFHSNRSTHLKNIKEGFIKGLGEDIFQGLKALSIENNSSNNDKRFLEKNVENNSWLQSKESELRSLELKSLNPDLTEFSQNNETQKAPTINDQRTTPTQETTKPKKDEINSTKTPLKLAFQAFVLTIKERFKRQNVEFTTETSNLDEDLEEKFFGRDREKKFTLDTANNLVPKEVHKLHTDNWNKGFWVNEEGGKIINKLPVTIECRLTFEANNPILDKNIGIESRVQTYSMYNIKN